MNLVKLNAMLRVYNSNFLNLHWNTVGEEFNDAHKGISTDYYELCDKYVDTTAEMIARFGINAPNYIEVANMASDFIVVDSTKLYTRKEIIEYADKMLGDICKCIVTCLAEDCMKEGYNTGIRSDLEAMHSEFDLQYRYINKRRLVSFDN